MNKTDSNHTPIREVLEQIKEWILDHAKIVMPLVLVICVLITVVIAMNANKKAALKEQQKVAETSSEAVDSADGQEKITIPEIPLEENAYPNVNAMINSYYEALASGDIDKVTSINNGVDDTEKIWIQESSKYIESYPTINVYTKKGPVDGSYVAYVYSEVKFKDFEQTVPGMETLYVCTNAEGNCYINEAEDSESVTNYIKEVSLQADFVELYNKITANYNDMLAGNEELNDFLADLSSRINVSMGEALAKAEAPETEVSDQQTEADAQNPEAPEAGEDGQETTADTQSEDGGVKKVRAKEVVNIRSSDSETADKVGKAQTGDEFDLLETKGNGWSKISFEDADAYIKSEFLEEVSDSPSEQADAGEAEDDTQEEEDSGVSSEPSADQKTVTVKETVNIRATESETGEKLGVAYMGEKLELITVQADGWCKVKYKGHTAYVKSEFVE